MSKQRFVVVGSGLAGFSAAIELASAGHEVKLFERSRQLGGRAVTHHEQGYAFNLGPHAFYRGGAMQRQFAAWGISHDGARPLSQGRSCLLANGKLYPFPLGTMDLLRNPLFSVRDKLRIGQALQKLQKIDPNSVGSQSMQAWIDSHAGTEKAALLLAAMTRLSTYAADLALLDAGAAIAQIQRAFAESVLYIDGGWETLIGGLARKAESLGVVTQTDCGVERAEPGKLELESGERIEADGIVLAVPPRDGERITGARLPATVPARAACLDLGLRRLPFDYTAFVLGVDTETYLSVHSLCARGIAPEGGATVHVAKYLYRNGSAMRAELEEVADIAMPGWRDEVAVSRFLPEMTVVHAIPQVGHGRPGTDALQMPGIAVAGDWVGTEAMLADAAVASGVQAARALACEASAVAAVS
jgi:phytoene dehydrogenase-like protein